MLNSRKTSIAVAILLIGSAGFAQQPISAPVVPPAQAEHAVGTTVSTSITVEAPAAAGSSKRNAWQVREHLLGLLRAGSYGALDAELSGLYARYLQGHARESDIGMFLRVMRGAGLDEMAKFDAWIKQMPESGIALLARGTFTINKGAQVRGSGYSNTVSRGKFDEMQRIHDTGFADFAAAQEKLPRCSMCLSGLINLAKHRGLRAESQRWITQALEIDPNALYAVINYSRLLETKWGGAAGEQEAFMEQMEKLHPSNAGLAALKAEPVRDRAAVLLRDKKVDQAIDAYRTAFQLFPEHNALSNLGSALIAKKQLPEAIDVLTQALDYEADDIHIFERRAWAYQQVNRHADAEADLVIALQLGSRWAFETLFRSYFGNGAKGAPVNQAKAYALCDKGALQGIPEAFWCLGGIYYFGQNGVPKDPVKAALWFERAVAKDVPGAKTDLGIMLWDGDGAITDKKRATKLWREAAAQGETRAAEKLESRLSAWEHFRYITLESARETGSGWIAAVTPFVTALIRWFKFLLLG